MQVRCRAAPRDRRTNFRKSRIVSASPRKSASAPRAHPRPLDEIRAIHRFGIRQA